MQKTQNMQDTQSYAKPGIKTLDLIMTAMLVALVFIATVFVNIKLPISANGGLVHLGTAMLFIASILYGPKRGLLLVRLEWDYLISLAVGFCGHQSRL